MLKKIPFIIKKLEDPIMGIQLEYLEKAEKEMLLTATSNYFNYIININNEKYKLNENHKIAPNLHNNYIKELNINLNTEFNKFNIEYLLYYHIFYNMNKNKKNDLNKYFGLINYENPIKRYIFYTLNNYEDIVKPIIYNIDISVSEDINMGYFNFEILKIDDEYTLLNINNEMIYPNITDKLISL